MGACLGGSLCFMQGSRMHTLFTDLQHCIIDNVLQRMLLLSCTIQFTRPTCYDLQFYVCTKCEKLAVNTCNGAKLDSNISCDLWFHRQFD